MDQEALWQIAKHVWSTGVAELNRLPGYIEPSVFSDCVGLLAGCTGRIVTSGCGTSASAARKIAHSLSCIERPSFFLDASDAAHGALGSVQGGDVVVLISKGGRTTELIALLPALRTKDIPVIAVTEDPSSSLAKAATLIVPIKIDHEADEFNLLATTSTLTVIAWFDAVCIALMRETGYTREQFAVIHPGGAVGERLNDGAQPSDGGRGPAGPDGDRYPTLQGGRPHG